MLRKGFLLFAVLILIPSFALTETIDVKIKGVDDGVKVEALTTAKDFVVQSDYIESQAEAVLLPGYNIVDVGHQTDGTYLVILIGKVKTSTPGSSSKEVGRDGRFIKYSNGVMWDTSTDLEWIAGPDRGTNWNEAKSWVENLTVAGGGWRMPTRQELKTLYKKGAGKLNMTPLLKTNGWYVWTGKTTGSSSAWLFGFGHGGDGWDNRNDSYLKRGFAVRFRR